MHKDAFQKIRRMNPEQLEQALIARPGTRGVPSSEKEMREYFGDEEFEHLQKLAQHAARTRTRAPVKGNIILLPGIMGSDLSTIEDGDEDGVWTNYARLIFGCIERLKLTSDGARQADPDYEVEVTSLNRRTYSRAVLWLRANWNLAEFPYDWRLDMDRSAHALAEFIRRKFNGQPVHLVAHSMGGLVSRNFIRLHQDLWQSMRDANLIRGGRLVMLGTPNYGSFTIPQVFTGAEQLLRMLEVADITHNMSELLETLNTFVGSYQLLPAPAKIPSSMQILYRRDTWGGFPVSEAHLNRAFQFHFDLEAPVTMDPERMIYVAGCNRETLSGLQMLSPGEFRYTTTLAGDGRVTHTLGLLPNVPTYYIEETHGDLARSETLLASVEELLERGRTSTLPTTAPAARSVAIEGAWRRSASDNQATARIEAITTRVQKKTATPEDLRLAEESLTRAALGRAPGIQKLASPQQRKERVALQVPFQIEIEVVHGDITRVQSPLIAVGRYNGTRPRAALLALDEALDYWISRASEHGMIGSRLGELFFIPVPANVLGAKAVLLAGMGDAGRFTREELRYLVANITFAASGLHLDRLAMVLIGAGPGGLTRERALRATLAGLCDAFARLDLKQRIKRLTLVENNLVAHGEILGLLQEMKEDRAIENLKLAVTSSKLPLSPQRRTSDAARPEDIPTEDGPHVTIERSGDAFRFSALTADAVVPVREIQVQMKLANGVAERLMNSSSLDDQEKYGRLLHTYLMPEDFQAMLAEGGPITLVLDRSTAAFPWEMGCFNGAQGPVFLGPNLSLTRQFRTMLSSTPGISPPINHTLKVLVIADPAPESELQLPGARREGRKVVEVLNSFKSVTNGPQLEVVSRIGSEECDPVEMLALILSEEFDIVHFAGHGVFDPEHPAARGWVFGRELIFSAREIFRARRVPRLVFANACFSAVVRPGFVAGADDTNRQLAGLAEAFFERGVQNYIGSGWPVDDEGAVTFADAFYQQVLAGNTLGDAISFGRCRILHLGSTWGAYQHYGDAGTRLLLPGKRTSQFPAQSPTKSRTCVPKPRKSPAKHARQTSANRDIEVLAIPNPRQMKPSARRRSASKR